MITASSRDPDITNNNDSATSVVGVLPNLYTTIDCSAQSINPTDTNICTVMYGNSGNTGTVDSSLSVTFSTGVRIDTGAIPTDCLL